CLYMVREPSEPIALPKGTMDEIHEVSESNFAGRRPFRLIPCFRDRDENKRGFQVQHTDSHTSAWPAKLGWGWAERHRSQPSTGRNPRHRLLHSPRAGLLRRRCVQVLHVLPDARHAELWNPRQLWNS